MRHSRLPPKRLKMTGSWDSLYLPSDDPQTIAATLRQSLETLGYTLYDPFGLLPGKSYAQTVRLFVAPARAGWVRVVGTLDPRLLMPLSASAPCLVLSLNGAEAVIEAYARGGLRDPEHVLRRYLRTGLTADHLRRALMDEPPEATTGSAAPDAFGHLPSEVQSLAGQVDPRQAQKMFDRISGNLLRKASSDRQVADEARELISPPDWGSPGARRMLAVVGCLTLPDNWREPDFVSLRDAYQLHARRRRKPDARLYPGDEDVMAAVPDALDYIPVYGGQDA
jgi:hypothetical protein